jgi:urease accessory protein
VASFRGDGSRRDRLQGDKTDRIEPMFDAISPSEQAAADAPAAPVRLQRLRGRLDLAFRRDADGVTRPQRLYQEGSARVRLPRAGGAGAEAVLINTGGGLTGGDRLGVAVAVEAAAEVTVTSQAAEKIYRAGDGEAEVETRLAVAAAGRLEWLPQESILFDGARLTRRLGVELSGDATLLAAEAVVFGRTARGEQVSEGRFADDWRIVRDGKPLFADAVRLEGDVAARLDRSAVGAGARAMATMLYVAPDSAARLDAARAMIAGAPVEGGASAWNGMLVARLLAADGQRLRAALVLLLEELRGRPLPRVWMC